MAAISLLRNTNMAAMTSYKKNNKLLKTGFHQRAGGRVEHMHAREKFGDLLALSSEFHAHAPQSVV